MNKPNVISNKLDKVPKTWEWYRKEVLNDPEVKNQIIKAFDSMVMFDWDHEVIDYLNEKNVPINEILKLEKWESLSFEVKREDIEGKDDFQITVWPPVFSEDIGEYLPNAMVKWEIEKWKKYLFIVVKRIWDKKKFPHQRDFKVHAVQLEIPWENALTMSGMFFMNKDVKWEEFKKLVEEKDENKKSEANIVSKEEQDKSKWKKRSFLDRFRK